MMNPYVLLFQKLIWNIREHGLVNLLSTLLIAIWRKIFWDAEYILYVDCTQLLDEGFSLPGKITIERYAQEKELPTDCLDQLKLFIYKKHMKEDHVNYYLREILNLFDDGGVLWLAKINHQVAGYGWSILEKNNYFPHFSYFPLSPHDGILLAGYTLPIYRGQRVVPTIIQYAALQLKKEGVQRLYARQKIYNKAGISSTTNAGLKRIGTVRSISLSGRSSIIWAKWKRGSR
jgi:hypothetical protein